MPKLTPAKYRIKVAFQYLNASDALFAGLKYQQVENEFHFLVTLRSFIEYTRRGIWFLAWANDGQLERTGKLAFDSPGSPGVAEMDKMINAALGLGNRSPLMDPTKEIKNEPFLNCLHALTHGNPISVRILAFGVDKIFQTDMLLLRSEVDLHLFRILLYRHIIGDNHEDIWKLVGPICRQPEMMKAQAKIAAQLFKDSGFNLP